jgi:hypothetical protein
MHSARSAAILVALLTVAATLASPDHLLALSMGAALAGGILLLWPTNDAPVLLVPFGLQWLAVAMKPIEAILNGQPLDNLGDFGQPLTQAAWFGLAGVSALGVGLWVGARHKKIDWAESLAKDAGSRRSGFVITTSLALIAGGSVLSYLAPKVGAATQIILAFSQAKDIGLFVLAYWCLKTGKALWIFALVAAFEVVIGLTGFFANFRETFLVLLAAAAAARPRLGPRGVLAVGGVFASMLVVTVFWSAIKHDYRDYLNQGSHAQIVDRTLSERLNYVGRAADDFDQNQLDTGLRNLVARLSYIDFLALTVNHVPEVRPFEGGRRLKGAIENILEPRIFFPDKPPTPNDTEITNRYTGLQISDNSARGASISIGYLGELYVDFGYVGATIGAMLIGLAGGLAFRLVRSYRGIPLFFSYGAAVMMLVPFTLFETDLVRFLGSAVTIFLAALVLQRALAPQLLLAVARRESRVQIA